MKHVLLSICAVGFSALSIGQTTLKGIVTDQKKQTIPGANIILQDTYDGATTDTLGKYEFTTDEKGSIVLNVTFVGYEPYSDTLNLTSGTLIINPILKESFNELKAVVIAAGAFEASDEGKAVVFRPLDIVTTAGADGDIYGALETLPGASRVGNDDGFYVRGGSDYETKTIIDGMVVENPYYSSVPDVPSRGRFAPFLFKGTVFSAGGYSAEYGQAMSSAIILNTDDMPEYSASGISLSPIFAGAFTTQKFKNTAIGGGINYTNLYLYNKFIPQTIDWLENVHGVDGDFYFRQKTSKTGIIKVYATTNGSKLGIRYPYIEDTTIKQDLYLKNTNNYINATYRELLGKNWGVNYGISYSKNVDGITLDGTDGSRTDELAQTKITFNNSISEKITMRFGAEYQNQYNAQNYSTLVADVRQNYEAAFAESDIYITNDIAGRVGLRGEYTDVLQKFNLAPRISLAYKVSKNGQVSAAYGDFYETPQPNYLYSYGDTPNTSIPALSYEKATHYIANYQVLTNDRTFRVEGYYKTYDNLVTQQFSAVDELYYSNAGDGYAKGIDVFYRDRKSIKNADFWISYSFLDTKRKFMDYPEETQPTFAADHILSVVYKQYIPAITTQIGATYRFISGWPYYNPTNPVYLGDVSPQIHDLSLNASYLTSLWGNFTVVFASVGNVLGFDQIYGYKYSSDGSIKIADVPPAKTTFFIGMFISFIPGGDDTQVTHDEGSNN